MLSIRSGGAHSVGNAGRSWDSAIYAGDKGAAGGDSGHLFDLGFDGDYSSYVTLSGVATHTNLPSGGWDGGGAAKFTANTTYGSNTGITPPDFTDANQINIRVVYKFGSTWNAAVPGTNKLMILGRSTALDTDRGMFLTQQSSYQGAPINGIVYHGYVSDNISRTPPDPVNLNLQPYINSGDWVCFEFQANLSSNHLRIYVTTRDGVLNETLKDSTTMASTSGLWSGIDIVGGYCQADGTVDANSYFIMDSLAVNNAYIGPPAGFVI